MITNVVLRGVGSPPELDIWDELKRHWGELVTSSAPSLDDYLFYMETEITETFRSEGYLIEDGVVVAYCFMFPAVDPHFGSIARPFVDYIVPEHRDNPVVVREYLRLKRQVVEMLGADRYLTVKHLSPTAQLHRLRFTNVRCI